ncbi:hypothetical protein JTE90_029139 [Oedothorax gibbosus]|uniref:C2H2-type domain-containing protein n=1 Tax=Oedothorax gibbosus TaxID=931172 RepID=A0AAV6UJQ4_9ARAC|nr:hypothetical protein JTE90_029139 [Oedothorax gibbosus]
MYRSYYYAEISILLLLYYAGWNFPSKNVFKCSRLKSRLVRMIIVKKVLPILHRYKLSLPLECPFHSERDALWWPDIQVDFQDGHWHCPLCGAAFSSEGHLVTHWDGWHTRTIAEDSVCFASFCDIFRCEVILAALEAEKHQPSWDTLPSFHLSQNRTSCDRRKMAALQKKCKVVMGECLLAFLWSLSSKDFRDIESEVNQAVCSYLTCNKYSDSSLQVVQPVPILVCLIVGFVLIGGFCCCYYALYSFTYSEYIYKSNVFCNGAPKLPSYMTAKDDIVYRRNSRGGYNAHHR